MAKDWNDLKKDIAEAVVDVEFDDKNEPQGIPRLKQVVWFPYRQPADAIVRMQILQAANRLTEDEIKSMLAVIEPAVFQHGKGCPLRDKTLVYAMFQSAHEYRVYAAGEGGMCRFTLFKAAANCATEDLAYEVFVQAVADELSALSGTDFDSARDQGRVAVVDEILSQLELWPEARAKIAKGFVEDDEDDEDDEDSAAPAPAPNGASSEVPEAAAEVVA